MIIKKLYSITDLVVLNTLLENEHIVYLIGKDNAKEIRSRLPSMAPKKYFDLQQQISVLKEYGGNPDYEKGEIGRGTIHDHVIANIFSGSISTFGLYNVMTAIENAPKNAYTEKRDWSILQVMPKKKLIKLATNIKKESNTTKEFIQILDLALRILSRYPQEDRRHVMSASYYAIKTGKHCPKMECHLQIEMTNQIYLDGLDGLVRDVNNIGKTQWIETRLPYVTQFQRDEIPLNLSGDFKDFE